jgi:hypothetical protein
MATQPEPPPPGPGDDRPPAPPTPQYRQSPRESSSPLNRYRKSAALKAIELLLRNPEVALNVKKEDIEPLRNAEDPSRRLLLNLIEKVHANPNIDIYTLYGACMATTLGGQLTQLQKEEKITPQEGIEQEFRQIVDSILSDIQKKLHILRLKEEANTRVSAANAANSNGPNSV